MISKAVDVSTYISELPVERRIAVERIRNLCLTHLMGYEEGMDYGMPVYKYNGIMEVSFASQKKYIALYVLKSQVVQEFRTALPGLSIGKGCIRFPRPSKIDFDVVAQILRRTAEAQGPVC